MIPDGHDVQQWHSRVPQGVPGAGWLVAVVFAIAAVTFSSWWWNGGHGARGAPPASYTNGAAH
jgi:hypothetical protein